MFAPGLKKNVQVVVSGNASSYNTAMAGALLKTTSFTKGVDLAIIAVTGLMTTMAGLAVKVAASFEQAMAKVKAISGAVGTAWKSLGDEAKRLGMVTQFTMVQIAEGMEVLARAGLKPIQIIETMGGVSALAASQNIELSLAADMVIGTLKAMHMPFSDAARVANLFAAGAASAFMTTTQLQEALVVIMPFASALGIEIEDLTVMIAMLAEAGIKGTKATTAMRTGFMKLGAPSAQGQKWIRNLGLEIFDATGKFVGLEDMIGQLEIALGSLTDQQKLQALDAIFGKRASGVWLSVINSGVDTYAKLEEEITGTSAAFEQAKTILDTVTGAWTLLTSSVTAAFQALGEGALGTVKQGLLWVKGMIDSLLERIRAIGPYIQAFFETLYLYVKKNRVAFGYLIKQILNMAKVVGVIALVAAAIKMLLSPVLWLTVAAVAMYAAWKVNLYGIRSFVDETITKFENWRKEMDWSALWAKINANWKEFRKNMSTFKKWMEGTDWKKVWKDFKAGLLVGGAALAVFLIAANPVAAVLALIAAGIAWIIVKWDDLKSSSFGEWAGVLGMPTDAEWAGKMKDGVLTPFWEDVKGFFSGVANIPTLLYDWLHGIMLSGDDWLSSWIDRGFDLGKSIIDGMIDGLTSGWSRITDWFTNAWSGIKGIFGGNSGNQFTPGANNPAGFALGGLIPGTGKGDTVAAMLEPGEFVVPNWMMKIPEIARLIKGIWSGGPKMAAGGAVGVSSGTSGSVAGSNAFTNILSGLDAIYEWLLPKSEDTEALDEMFTTIRTFVSTGSELSAGYQEQLRLAFEQIDAGQAAVDALNAEAEAAADAADAANELTEELNVVKERYAELKGLLSSVGGYIGLLGTAVLDFSMALQEGTLTLVNGVGMIYNLLSGLIRQRIADLQEEFDELSKTIDVYNTAFKQVANITKSVASNFGFLGQIASAFVDSFVSSLQMLSLSGFDLLQAGISMLTSLVGSLINAFTSLVKKSDAYGATQEQGQRATKALANLFGQFLWPLAALLKNILDWLGIQEAANNVAEVGVVQSWKRQRRAYEAGSPGQVVTSGSDIPAWATELVVGIADSIKTLFEGWGITNWEDLMEKAKNAAVKLWDFIDKELPGWINWFKVTFWPAAERFLGLIWDNIKAVWNWLSSVDWDSTFKLLEDKFGEFQLGLEGLMDFEAAQTDLARVATAIEEMNEKLNTLNFILSVVTAILVIMELAKAVEAISEGVGGLIDGLGSIWTSIFGGGTAAAATSAGVTTGVTAATAGTVMAGTPAQFAALSQAGAPIIGQAIASALVPFLLGTQSHEQIQKTDKFAREVLAVPIDQIEKADAKIHKLLPSKNDKIRAEAEANGTLPVYNQNSWTCPHCGLWRSKRPRNGKCPNCKKRDTASGFALGGFVTKPTVSMVGEGRHAEGVFPLSTDVFKKFSVGIVRALTDIPGFNSPSIADGQSERVMQTAMRMTEYSIERSRRSKEGDTYLDVDVYVDGEVVKGKIVEKIRSRSRNLIGNRGTMVAVTGRG